MRKIVVCHIFFGVSFVAVVAQNVPRVLRSNLIDDVTKHAQRSPGIKAEKLAQYANRQLEMKGYEFETDPCDLTIEKTKESFAGSEGDEGVKFSIYNVSSKGKKIKFMGREPDEAPCGCWFYLPLKKALPSELVVVSENGSFTLAPPKKLLIEHVYLVDNTLKKQIREWTVPEGGGPDGISVDGRKLYIKSDIPKLLLEIDQTGALRFVPMNSSGIITKHTDLKKFPKDNNNAYLGYRRFTAGRKILTVKFSEVCT